VVIVAVLFAASAAHATGKIVVAHDEWILSDIGFQYAPSTQQFAQHRQCFYRRAARSFSRRPATSGRSLTPRRMSLPIEGVHGGLRRSSSRRQRRAHRVRRHWRKCICGGGDGFGISDSIHWNGCLKAFALHLDKEFDTIAGLFSVAATHDLFEGVSSLIHVVGNSIRTTGLVPGAPSIPSPCEFSGCRR